MAIPDPNSLGAQSPLAELTPERIMQLGLGFMASRTVLSAVDFGVFTALAGNPMEGEMLARQVGLHPRGARDFLDTLVALGLLNRNGQVYSNTPETDFFLDRAKKSYVGGMLEMSSARLYRFWGSLTEALKTGLPQSETKSGEKNAFETLYADPERLGNFLRAMTGLSMGAARNIAEKFPWRNYSSFADVGGAQGGVAAQIALKHPHLQGIVFDLPEVKPHAEGYLKSMNLESRVRFVAGDFFKDPLPKVDVIIMGHILHDWDLAEKKRLISKAYEAIPAGGAFLALDCVIDDERRGNPLPLLVSLNMLIETPGGFDYCGADCRRWMAEAGFRETRVEHMSGPDSIVVGIK
jgi:hypothetical protein